MRQRSVRIVKKDAERSSSRKNTPKNVVFCSGQNFGQVFGISYRMIEHLTGSIVAGLSSLSRRMAIAFLARLVLQLR